MSQTHQMKTTLTPEELALVKRIQGETGIVTVKCAETGFPGLKPFGQYYNPAASVPGSGGLNNRCIRHICYEFRNSPVFPDGIPVGYVEIETRSTMAGLGGDSSYRGTGGKRDISSGEYTRLRSLANGHKHYTEKELEADFRAKERARSARMADPSGDAVRGLAAAFAKALAGGGFQSDEPEPDVGVAVADEPAPVKRGPGRPRKVAVE